MKREVKELKRIARKNLQGNYSEMIRAFVACNMIVTLVEFPFAMMRDDQFFSTSSLIYYAAVILIGIASVVLTAGQKRMHLTLARTGKAQRKDLFIPLKYHSDRFIFTELIVFAISLIGFIPLIGALFLITTSDGITYYIIAGILAIIGIVLSVYISVTFDLVYFVMNDNEDLSMLNALKSTMQLINGYKKSYFYLLVSFLGMMLLVLLSFGLGAFWVQPYKMQTCALFYLDLKGELDVILEERKKNEPAPEPTVINHYA